jgi:hypothetical protein
MQSERWMTVGEAAEGIELLLRDGPQTLLTICRHTDEHGMDVMSTIGLVRRLCDADRIAPTGVGSSNYALTELPMLSHAKTN